MKKIKKYLGFIILLLVGVVCGALTIVELEGMNAMELPFGEYMLTLLIMIGILYAVLFLQIILHEAGHLVFGLCTGYRFSSFRVGSLMWVKQDGKIRLKKFSLAGTGGQCLLLPPPMVDGKFNYVLYNLGGCLVNLATAAVCVPLLFFCENGLLHFFLLLTAAVGVGYALINGIPMNVDGVPNDGYNARSLGRNPKALRSFWVQMKINEGQSAGVRLKDMPAEWFEMPSKEDMKNGMCSALAVLRTSWLMDKHEFKEAAESIDALLQDSREEKIEVAGIYRKMISCDRIFCELIGEGNRDVIDGLLNKELLTTIKQMKNMIGIIRIEYALALLSEKDEKKAAAKEALFEKQAAKYPHPAEVQAERELMALAKEKAETLGAVSS